MTLKKREGKHKLNQLDMTKNKDFGGGRIKAKINVLSARVPYEDTWFRMGGKLMSEVRTKLGIAKRLLKTRSLE